MTGHCTFGHLTLLVCKISNIPLMVLEILGLKLKNENNDKKKNLRNRFLPFLLHMLVVQLSQKFRVLAVSK